MSIPLSNYRRPGATVMVSAAAALLLAGCAGSQSSTLPGQGLPSAQHFNAAPACREVAQGKARCLAIIESRSGISRSVAGWGPADFQARYKLPSGTKGAGQIVAIVDAYDNPNVASDLATYRSEFGLGSASFTKYNQEGQTSNYPTGDTSWGTESDLDAQMVSATCPLCTIYLVEANSSSSSDIAIAEKEAVTLGAHIVTNSWACTPAPSCVSQRAFEHKNVIYLAATGDSGSGDVGAPAAFGSVAAIGGTTLSKNGSQYSEVIWDDSSGGCQTREKKPKWQHDDVCPHRAVADASAVANGVAEYDTYGNGGWFTVGGTSVAAPLLAGVFGLAGNAARQDGGRTFWQTKHHKHLYDVCGGSCLFSTYSYPGGWGSPNGIAAF